MAATAYEHAKQLRPAVAALLRVQGTGKGPAIERAIDLIKSAPADLAGSLAQMVHGSMDRGDKDKFAEQFFALNVALGNYNAAGLSAIEMALMYQKNGEYKVWRLCSLLDALLHPSV